ncbi:phytoene desaturase family protein [Sphingomicrobium lutaoense]|uniref:Pyridine nucleotide-disulfide oxidoreductase domain-containing protein 2 n=1 Tax=Sphingomicrobium lutaoense TaxID=515949 RepID=A0A839Z368_9SPHN|nr:NAD(P)/FAD-dependent oxidoreductase [Sphingomicrobium lutaoense]MBB3764025.1 phytoene dehydrogenase-like protein [Sphingomicrobium lutaoense]
MHDVVVIGAGHNGLVCSYYLARKGLKVALIEAAETVGGAAVTDEFHPGFRNSAASYTVSLLQPKVIADMELERHGLEVVLRKVDNFLPGGGHRYLLAGRDGLTRSELARHHRADGPAYDRYIAELELVVGIIRKWLLKAPVDVGRGLAGLPDLIRLGKDLYGLDTREVEILHRYFTKSAGEILDGHFEGEMAKALFGFDGIVGNFASPYDAGTGYVLLHHLFGEAAGVEGAWGHAIGGMGAITQAMARACREAGVDIVLGTPVSEIIIANDATAGVVAGGKAWRADKVVAGVNPRLLFKELVPDEAVERRVSRHFANWACESATFRMNVALDRLPNFTALPGRGDHLTAGIIIGPSLDYMEKAHASAVLDGWSREPVVEMLLPSTLDATLAPRGKHVASLFCQHFRYSLPDGKQWDDVREEAADHVIRTVDRHAPGFADSVVARQIHSPLDLERRFGLVGGDIFHGKMGLDQLFNARPMIGASDYRMPLAGLYLCGSGAHPGGGVTGAPGHNAARAVIADSRKWKRGS